MGDDHTIPLKDDTGVMEWIPVCECPAGFPKELVRIPSKLLSIMPENKSNSLKKLSCSLFTIPSIIPR